MKTIQRVALAAAITTVASIGLGKFFDKQCETSCLMAAGKASGDKSSFRFTFDDNGLTINDGSSDGELITDPLTLKLPEISKLEGIRYKGINTNLTITAGTALEVQAVNYRSDKKWSVTSDGKVLSIDVQEKGPETLIITLPSAGLASIEVQNISGDIRIGDRIDLQRFDLKTTSGDSFFASVPKDEFSINTVSGDVSVKSPDKVSKTLRINTVSADISLNIPSGFASLKSNSVSGDVSLSIVGAPAFKYRMHSITGDFQGLKGGHLKEGIANREMSGRLGGAGDSELEFESISGDFQLTL